VTRTRGLVTAIFILVTVFASVGVRSAEYPRLIQPGGDPDGWFGMADGYVESGEPMLLTSEVIVCLDRPGRVEIVEVALERVEGELHIDTFAVRSFGPDYPDLEAEEDTFWRVGFDRGPALVDVVCPEPEEMNNGRDVLAGRWMHLGISISKPSETTARGSTLLVYYIPEGRSKRHVFRIPFGFVLCEGAVHDEGTGIQYEECDYLNDDYYHG
jgi:hypothetical protein